VDRGGKFVAKRLDFFKVIYIGLLLENKPSFNNDRGTDPEAPAPLLIGSGTRVPSTCGIHWLEREDT